MKTKQPNDPHRKGSKDAQDRTYSIPIGGERVPVSEAVYRAYWQSYERERYLEKRDAERSYAFSQLEAYGVPADSYLGDGRSAADEALERAQIAALYEALATLPEGGDWLLALYAGETTERALARRWGISPGAAHKRKLRALKELRRHLTC